MADININELYIKEIEDSLKNGHAAVLIGSGFSKNAEPIDNIPKSAMLDWIGLSEIFCKKLGETSEFQDPLTLAQEFEVMYGRPQLDNLLKNNLDDSQYLPSELHYSLMRLPWTDVFTTNYDLLLERACKKITDRKYRVVVNQDDLLYSSGQPRIIKLHGSFPSDRPFIITEEDFRKYPYDHAPFVNTVQQSLLENTLVIIGFSGNDPNFLKWIGWIHDNLGLQNSPKMYIITYKADSTIKLKSLAAKNIETIVINDIDEFKTDNYKDSLLKFLLYLEKRCNIDDNNSNEWPNYGCYVNDFSEGKKLIVALTETHKNYPGWLMIPYSIRSRVTIILTNIEHFFFIAKDSDCEFEICYEYCWLCKKMGIPLPSNIINIFEKNLENNKNNDKINKSIYKDIQMYLLFSYRIYNDECKWNNLFEELSSDISLTNNDLLIALNYEKTMFDLYTLNWRNIENDIDQMNIDSSQNEWVLKKSGLLALLGKFSEAEDLLRESIFNLRYNSLNNQDQSNNEAYSSLDNCMVALYKYIHQSHKIYDGDFSAFIENTTVKKEDKDEEKNKDNDNSFSSNNQLDYRKIKDSYSWQAENEKLLSDLLPEYVYKPSKTTVPNFDIGLFSVITRMSEDSALTKAYIYNSFRETTGYPFRICSLTSSEGIVGMGKRIIRNNFALSSLFVLLTANNKFLNEIITRKELANCSQSEIDKICKRGIELLMYSLDIYDNSNVPRYKISLLGYPLQVMPEFLSILSTRCSEKIFDELIKLLIELYRFNRKDLLPKIRCFTERIINNMPLSYINNNLNKFLSVPIVSKEENMFEEFVDPFMYIYNRIEKQTTVEKFDISDKELGIIEYFFKKAEDENFHNAAIIKLTYIHQLFKLPSSQCEKLKELLWDKKNIDEYDLPRLGYFHPVIFDRFPNALKDSQSYETKKKEYILKSLKKLTSTNKIRDVLNMSILVLKECAIDKEFAENIINLVLGYCENYVKTQSDLLGIGGKEIRLIDYFVGNVIVLSGLIDNNQSYVSDDVLKIIEILDAQNCPHVFLTWCTSENRKDSIIIEPTLTGDDVAIQKSSRLIQLLHQNSIVLSENIISHWINAIYFSTSYNVQSYMNCVDYFVKNSILNEMQSNQVTKGLAKIEKLTKLSDEDTMYDVAQKLVSRKAASQLAKSLYDWYKNNDIDIPAKLLTLQDTFNNDNEFAEIRLCWE